MAKSLPSTKHYKSLFEILGFMRDLRRDLLGTMQNAHTAYGDNVIVWVADRKQLLTKDPDLIRDVFVTKAASFIKDGDYTDPKNGLARFFGSGLLTSNGDFWKRQRKLVAPSLHAKRIEAYADAMVQYTLDQLDKWQNNAHLDISQEMNAITMRIVGKTMFNVEVGGEIGSVHEAMKAVQEAMISAQVMPIPTWIPTPSELRARRADKTLNEFVYKTIALWKQTGEDKGDLLSMLLLARDEDDNPMTDVQARDEVLTLFLAGHETTANALNWTWMLLSQNPQVAQKLHEETDRVLGGTPPTLADLRRLPYTEMVVKEVLRLYPPAYNVGREAIEDVEAGGYFIPKGTIIAVNIYGVHRHPNYWQDPEAFIPERFSPENEANSHRYAYVPFGGGPRVCIGNSFAMMEAQLLLATIAQRFTLHLAPNQVVKMLPAITLNPAGGLPMTVKARVNVKEMA